MSQSLTNKHDVYVMFKLCQPNDHSKRSFDGFICSCVIGGDITETLGNVCDYSEMINTPTNLIQLAVLSPLHIHEQKNKLKSFDILSCT